ncbi:hypothetical protein [Flavobacterium sp.]|jgi:hypothetical protein|uniref:hypothetical protein n=1 Tax=Flavobacterium sp. TaxID=239 RepID=UPI0037BFB009
MKYKMQELIYSHKNYKQEVYMLLNELSKINKNKLLKEEKKLLEDQLLLLEQEHHLRSVFISELESLL